MNNFNNNYDDDDFDNNNNNNNNNNYNNNNNSVFIQCTYAVTVRGASQRLKIKTTNMLKTKNDEE